MKVVEIMNVFTMDAGAPQPLLIFNEHDTTLMFLLDADASSPEDSFDDADEKLVGVLKFTNCIKLSSGVPSNETLAGHPYFAAGLESYSFYEVEDSDLIRQLMLVQSVHPYYDPTKWSKYKHFIITFHDSTFECVATGYSFKRISGELYFDLVNAPSLE
jgi:hypothetical protein